MIAAINSASRRLPTWVVYAAGALPFLWLVWLVTSGGIGPDPVKAVERQLGSWALKLLLATMAITPLRRLGVMLIKHRRALGVLAFVYALLHLTAWVWLDLAFRWGQIGEDLVKRPYIIVGMIGLLAMLPLALTSTNAMIRRLGPVTWGRLHRLAYVALAAGAIHLAMQSKVWTVQVLVYLALAALLLAVRLLPRDWKLAPARNRA